MEHQQPSKEYTALKAAMPHVPQEVLTALGQTWQKLNGYFCLSLLKGFKFMRNQLEVFHPSSTDCVFRWKSEDNTKKAELLFIQGNPGVLKMDSVMSHPDFDNLQAPETEKDVADMVMLFLFAYFMMTQNVMADLPFTQHAKDEIIRAWTPAADWLKSIQNQ